MEIREIDRKPVEKLNVFSEALDEAILNASNIGRMPDDVGIGPVYEQTYLDLKRIKGRLTSAEFVVEYSGVGLMNLYDDSDQTFKTCFAKISKTTGIVKDLVVLEPDEYAQVDSEEHLSEPEEIDGDLDEIDSDDEYIGVEFVVPKSKPRLFIEFLSERRNEQDQFVGGITLRTDEARRYDYVDAESIHVTGVQERKSDAENDISEDFVEEVLLQEAEIILNLMKSHRFRREKAPQQKTMLESKIDEVNELLEIDRFSAFVIPQEFFVVTNWFRRRADKLPYEKVCQSDAMMIRIKPLRIDAIDMFSILSGTPIKLNSDMVCSDAGIYMVGTVDHCSTSPSLVDQDIWIPIKSQVDKKRKNIIFPDSWQFIEIGDEY